MWHRAVKAQGPDTQAAPPSPAVRRRPQFMEAPSEVHSHRDTLATGRSSRNRSPWSSHHRGMCPGGPTRAAGTCAACPRPGTRDAHGSEPAKAPIPVLLLSNSGCFQFAPARNDVRNALTFLPAFHRAHEGVSRETDGGGEPAGCAGCADAAMRRVCGRSPSPRRDRGDAASALGAPHARRPGRCSPQPGFLTSAMRVSVSL